MLSLPVRPQRTAMRNRLLPSAGGGYDFHRQFRLLAHRYLSDGEDFAGLIAETEGFGNAAEGRAAREALGFIEKWRLENQGRIFSFEPKVWESESSIFKVKFSPDFGIEIEGASVAVHIWKTQKPPLDIRMTYAAMSLFPDLYAEQTHGPQDLAVLSVLDGQLYRLSDAPDQSVIAARVMSFFGSLIEEIGDEIAPLKVPPTGDTPSNFP